ncbi:MAG: carbonic anhydrase family protein [Renibacterium sp.]|nr:carbonic anhydrase family protein [Renibacterium sp.]
MKMNTSIKRGALSLPIVLGLVFTALTPASAQWSPITIDEQKVVNTEVPAITYNNFDPYRANVTLKLQYESGGPTPGSEKQEDNIKAVPYNQNFSITMQGKPYQLKNIHWHVKSEHSLSVLNPSQSAMEQHMVFADAAGKSVVLASMMQIGNSQAATTVGNIVSAMPTAKVGTSYVYSVNLGSLLTQIGDRYDYTGSFTTYPHTENVQWIVFESPMKVSQATVDRLASLLPNGSNNAPLNPVSPSTTIYHGKA